MPRKRNIDRPTRLELKLPESVRTRLDLFLFSEVENKVPKGEYQKFFTERTVAFFQNARVELEAFGFPVGYYVEGPKEMIAALIERLKK